MFMPSRLSALRLTILNPSNPHRVTHDGSVQTNVKSKKGPELSTWQDLLECAIA